MSRRVITRYVEAGCPHERVGLGPRAKLHFDAVDVRAWMRITARTGTSSAPAGAEVYDAPNQARVLEALLAAGPRPPGTDSEVLSGGSGGADLVELARKVNIEIKRLEVQKRTRLERKADGELVPLDDVRRAWRSQIEVVHARFRALPASLAPRLVGKEYDAIRDALEGELRSVLLSFSREELDI
ncbi:MAG: hypothetical protein ACTSX8_10395 [Alphaproteobacteria bacterium]